MSDVELDDTQVKEYGNRRLYRTDESRYITLPEVGDMVADEGLEFPVQKTVKGANSTVVLDRTSFVLCKVVTEAEKVLSEDPGTVAALTPEFLRFIICLQRKPEVAAVILPHLTTLGEQMMATAEGGLEGLGEQLAGFAALDMGEVEAMGGAAARIAGLEAEVGKLVDLFLGDDEGTD